MPFDACHAPRSLFAFRSLDIPGMSDDGAADAGTVHVLFDEQGARAEDAACMIFLVWGDVWEALSEHTRRGIVLARALRADVPVVRVWEALAVLSTSTVDVD